MRTKTILLAAALSAAGLATSLAQSNVYSLNVVGYVNIPTPTNGTYLIGNPLDLDGTGVNNTLTSVLGDTGHPIGTIVFGFDPTTGGYVQDPNVAGTWVAGAAKTFINANSMNPGQGFFYKRVDNGPTNLTIVGNVLQGALVNTPFVGVNIISSKVPQAGGVTSVLGLQLANNAVVPFQTLYRHYSNSGLGTPWTQNAWSGTAWLGSEPVLNVAEAVFVNAKAGSTWTRNFTVQ